MIFQNRQGSNLNRKRLRIVSQTAEEIIADVERADSPTVEGTPIDASVMNQFQSEIDTANSNASTAVSTANSAVSTANTASQNASTAVSTANAASTAAANAVSTANAASTKADYVESQLADRGATVKFNGVTQSEVNFDSDPQTQINAKLNKDFSTYTEKNPIVDTDIFAIVDSSTNSNKKVLLSTIKRAMLDASYPVGAIYLSVNSTSPGTLFGGTWEQIQDKFLLSAGSTYTAGSTGGEATHTLTSNEMPSHNHSYDKSSTSTGDTSLTTAQIPSHNHQIWSCNNWSGNVLGANHNNKVAGVGFVENRGYNETWYNTKSGGQQIIQNTGGSESHNHTISLSSTNSGSTGGGQAHNNMPPYLTVYMWKRIS